MKKISLVLVCLLGMSVFSYGRDFYEKTSSIYFSGLAFSNITAITSTETTCDQLLGWQGSSIQERPWGSIYSKYGIFYNVSEKDIKNVIGINPPSGIPLTGFNSDSVYFPSRRGYAFRPQLSKNVELVLAPLMGINFFVTGVEYKTIDPVNTMLQTKYSGYTVGFDLGLGFDASVMHTFSNMYLRYGLEISAPLVQFSATKMRKQESSDGGLYYGSSQRADRTDLIAVNEVFKLELSPYIAVGIRINSRRNWHYDSNDESDVARK